MCCGLKAHLFNLLQASKQKSLHERIADLESMLSATQKRCADQAAELAGARQDQRPTENATAVEADWLACLEGNAAALAQCSIGQLYRSHAPQPGIMLRMTLAILC